MPRKIKVVAASTFPDRETGWRYSEAALKGLARQAGGQAVVFQKRNVGRVESGEFENGRLVITANIDELSIAESQKLYLTPGGLTDFDTKGDIFDRCTAHHYFFSDTPGDQTLTPFESLDR